MHRIWVCRANAHLCLWNTGKNEAIHEFRVNPSLERNVSSNWHYEVHPLITFVTVIFVHVIAKITFYNSKSRTFSLNPYWQVLEDSSKTFPKNSVFRIMSLTLISENSSMRILLWVPFQFFVKYLVMSQTVSLKKLIQTMLFSTSFVLNDFSTNTVC